MELAFDYHTDLVIPVDPHGIARLGAEAWAAETAAAFADAAGIAPELRDRLTAVLASAAAAAPADSWSLLLVGAEGRVLAPLTVFVAERALPAREQVEFLWSPTAIMPPAPARVETSHLGVGFSSTLAHREEVGDFATRRWLFFGHDMTVGAALGPVAPYGLALVSPIADAVLDGTRVEGFVPVPGEARVAELMTAAERTGDDWKA